MKLLNLKDISSQSNSHNERISKRVWLANHELGNITQLAQSVFPPGEKVTKHSHLDMSEVFVVKSGRGLITIDGITHDIRPGTCAVVEPGENHELGNNGEEDLVLICFGLRI